MAQADNIFEFLNICMQAGGRLVKPLEVIKQVQSESWDGERMAYALPPGLVLVGDSSAAASYQWEFAYLPVSSFRCIPFCVENLVYVRLQAPGYI